MRRTRSLALLGAAAVVASTAAPVFADTVYASSATLEATPGATASFTIGLRPETNGPGDKDDVAGCNATAAKPVTISFSSSTPSVAAAPSSVQLTGCDNPSTTTVENGVLVPVTAGAAAVSGSTTTLTANGGGGQTVLNNGGNAKSGTFNTTTVQFTVRGKLDQATLTVTGPTGGTFGQSYPITTGGGSGTGALSYAASGAACTLDPADATKVKITSGTGACAVTATKAEDTTYKSATSSALSVVASKAAQTLLTLASPTGGTFGQSYALTSNGGSGTGAVTFTASGAACNLGSDGKLAIVTGADDCTVTANKATDPDYLPATSAATRVAISKAAQAALQMTSAATATFGDVVTLTSQGGSSSGATSYTASGTACSIPTTGGDAGKLTITSGTGTCSVTATKAGDGNYASVDSAAQTVIVGRKAQEALVVVAAQTGTFGQELPLGTTGGNGSGTVSYSVGNSTACALDGATTLRITSGTGTCLVTATKPADGNFTEVSSVDHEVSAQKALAQVDLSGLTATYDGTVHRATVTTVPANLADVTTVTYDASASAPRNAGSYTVVASLDHPDYVGSDSDTLTVAAKQVAGGFTVTPRAYDGSRTAVVTPTSLDLVQGDSVTLLVSNAQFDTKDAGQGKTVTGDLSLTGGAAANYALASTTATAQSAISPLQLTGSFTADDKDYNRSPAATVLTRSLPGVISPDTVEFRVTDAAFASSAAGENRTVTAALALAGNDASNYSLSSGTATDTATIRQLQVTGGITATDKVYDATTAAHFSRSLPGILAADAVTLDVSNAAFGTKDVAESKPVTATLDLSGGDAANYRLTSTSASSAADITQAGLVASYEAISRPYNGTTSAGLENLEVTQVLGQDNVILTVTDPTFADKNAGRAKAVTGTLGLLGTDAGNYRITNTPAVTANITPKTVTPGFEADDKVYDGTVAAGGTRTLGGKVDGDDLHLGGAATFADKTVGTGKEVTLTGLALEGADKNNYALSSTDDLTDTAAITARSVTAGFTAANKVYDATAAAQGARTLTDKVTGDSLTLAGTATFADKNVGPGKTVTLTGLALDGADAQNYALASAADLTSQAAITPKALTASITANDKVWDGTTDATTASRTLGGAFQGDEVSLGGTPTFDTAAPGSNKLVTLNGATLLGNDRGNYSLGTTPITARASILRWTYGAGFKSPVSMDSNKVNQLKAGSTVPLKFNVFSGSTEQRSTAAIQRTTAVMTSCDSGDLANAVPVESTGSTSLRYDEAGSQFVFNWKAPSQTGCYKVGVILADGTSFSTDFKVTK